MALAVALALKAAMSDAKIYVALLGGFAVCLLLGVAMPFLRLRRKMLKGFVLGIPLVVLAALTLGQQGMTNRFWEAIIPFACCFLALGLDLFLSIRDAARGDLFFCGGAAFGCAWSGYVSWMALDNGFMGASC